jgi:hypothetical protein
MIWLGALAGLVVVTGCSVKTEPSEVICVPDQSDICTDCPASPSGDTQSGHHTCAHDGKSFGACGQCAPGLQTSGFKAGGKETGPPVILPDPGTPPIFDATCAGKLAVLAGKDDPNDSFIYAAVFDGTAFRVSSTSGAPMRSAAAVATSGNSVVALYRSKSDTLVTTTFANGTWSAPTGISATSNGTPAMTTWGGDLKAIFRQDNGFHWVATFTSGAWGTSLVPIGDLDLDAPSGISEPSAVSTGAPGLPGAAITVGYTDDGGGLYHQSWSGTDWFATGIKSQTVNAGQFRPEIIPMTAGSFDLISTYITSDGVLHASTRTSLDRGSVWSPDAVTNDAAHPIDAVHGLGLPLGRAMVVFLDDARHAQFMIFDPTTTPVWSKPAPVFAENAPALASTPQLVADPCGGAAMLAYATSTGAGVLRFINDAWSAPVSITGIPETTYATPVAVVR